MIPLISRLRDSFPQGDACLQERDGVDGGCCGTFYGSADLSPLISRLRDSFPPRGSLLRYLLGKENINFFSKTRRIQNLENKIALSNRLPLGGKLARKRLMRGDKFALS